MKVSQLMNPTVVTVSSNETAAFASSLLARHNLGALPVCSADGTIRGMVTDRDIVLRCIASDNDPWDTPLRDIMSRGVVTASPEDSVDTVAELMARSQVRRLPVVRDNKIVGIVSLGDLATSGEGATEASRALREISENVRRM